MSIRLDNQPPYQTAAVFYYKPQGIEDITGIDYVRDNAERKSEFAVEKVVVLPDQEYALFLSGTFRYDWLFIFDNQDAMWFDPAEQVWHCLLVKGETSRDGILIDSEGYSFARYAAYIRDCSRLQLRDIPIQYEHPATPQSRKPANRHSQER